MTFKHQIIQPSVDSSNSAGKPLLANARKSKPSPGNTPEKIVIVFHNILYSKNHSPSFMPHDLPSITYIAAVAFQLASLHLDLDLALHQGSVIFFCKVSVGKCLGFMKHMNSVFQLSSTTVAWKQPIETSKLTGWLYFNKTSFIKIGSRLNLVHGQYFADSCSDTHTQTHRYTWTIPYFQ